RERVLVEVDQGVPARQFGRRGSLQALGHRRLAAAHRPADPPAAHHAAQQVQTQYVFDLVHRKPLLSHRFAPRAKGAKGGGVKGLRRDAPVGAESGYRLRAGDGGQRYEIMADTVPGRPSKCPPFRRNRVRHGPEHAAGGRVYGYRRVPVPSPSGEDIAYVVLEIREEEARIVHAAFRAYADGYGCRTIAHALSGHTTPLPAKIRKDYF